MEAVDAEIDLEAVINEFLADAEKSELELPRSLTAAQRKEAKRLADQHETLKSESYGYGEDRRLHLFKKEDRVKVKNTFIDGWENDAGEGGEAPAFRSMPCPPVALLERTLQRCQQGPPGSSLEGSPEASPGGLSSSASQSAAELPPMPEGFQVRNTFIHIESVPEVERMVQTMPDGDMFRQCLEKELAAQRSQPPGDTGGATAAAAPAPAPVPAPRTAPPSHDAAATVPSAVDLQDQGLAPGTEVIIQGLVKLPDFNGLTGVVQSLDAESGRYDVLLDGPAGQCGWRWVKVKGENCRLKMPPAPLNAPTLSLDTTEGEEGSKDIPPTPKWEEDFACQAGTGSDARGLGLKLDALV